MAKIKIKKCGPVMNEQTNKWWPFAYNNRYIELYIDVMWKRLENKKQKQK